MEKKKEDKLDSFIKLYKKVFKEDITRAEAQVKSEKLLRLVKIVMGKKE